MGFYFNVSNEQVKNAGLIFGVAHEADAEMAQLAEDYLDFYQQRKKLVLIVEVDEVAGLASLSDAEKTIHAKVGKIKKLNKEMLETLGFVYDMEKIMIAKARTYGIPVISINSLTEHLLVSSAAAVQSMQASLNQMPEVPERIVAFQKKSLLNQVKAYKAGDEQNYWNVLMSCMPAHLRQRFVEKLLVDKNRFIAEKFHYYLTKLTAYTPLMLSQLPNLLGQKGVGNLMLKKGWQINWDQAVLDSAMLA